MLKRLLHPLSRWRRVCHWMVMPALLATGVLRVLGATLPPGVTLYGAAFGSGTFVGVGENGAIFSSINGGSWQQRLSGTTNRLQAVAFGDGQFVTVGGNGLLLSSPDGITWSNRSLTVVQGAPQIAYGNGRFVIAGQGGVGKWTMLVSSNAAEWTTFVVDAADGLPVGGLAFGAGRFIAAGGNWGGAKLFLHSTDGITWKEQGAEGTSPDSSEYGPMFYGNHMFAIIENAYFERGEYEGYFDQLLLSPDGVHWVAVGDNRRDWKAAAAGDCTYVLAGDNPAGTSRAIRSAGRNGYWEELDAPVIDVVNAVVFGDGKYLAFGSDVVELPVRPASTLLPISPETSTVEAGNRIYFALNAGDPCLAPPVSYQWRHNDVVMPGATNHQLVFDRVAATNDAGRYTVTASNALGQTAMSIVAQLNVEVVGRIGGAPVIEDPTAPYTIRVPRGADAYLWARVTAGAPWMTLESPTSLRWRLNGVDLPGATNVDLWLPDVGAAAEGTYTLFASNRIGRATSPEIILSTIDSAPSYFTSTQNFTVREGSPLELVSREHYIFPSARWPRAELHVFKDNLPYRLPLQPDYGVALQRTELSEAGEYQFVVSNALGTAIARVANVTVIPSEPLDHWTQRNPLPQNERLFDVAQGNGVFVAVGDHSTIVFSTNGLDWMNSRIAGETPLSSIAFGNGVFAAVGGPNIFTSTNGQHWTLRVVRLASGLGSPRAIFANDRFVVAGGDRILTSLDGVTWREALLTWNYDRHFRDVAFGNGHFVAVGRSSYSPPSVWTSPDGENWLPLNGAPGDELDRIAFGHGHFLTAGNHGLLYTSPNGTDWTRQLKAPDQPLRITYGAGKFVGVGPGGTILSSGNGVHWSTEASGAHGGLENVRFLNNQFIAVGEHGTILISSNASTWTEARQGTRRDLNGMSQGAGLLVVAGQGGIILTSSDSTHFARQTTGVTNDLYGIGYANGLFVAVGESEIIMTSSNALDWQTRHRGGISSLKNAAGGSNGWVAVGTEGTILTSVDGAEWTPRTSPTGNDLNDVVYGNGLYVVVGGNLPPNGTTLTSPDGVTWTRRPLFGGQNLLSVDFVNNTFMTTAHEGLMVSSNGIQWQWTGLDVTGYGFNFRAGAYAAGAWVLVGDEGTVVSSFSLWDTTQRYLPTREDLHRVIFFNGRFVAIGSGGTILQSPAMVSAPSLAGRARPGGFEITVTGTPGMTCELQGARTLWPQQWNSIRTFTLQQANTNILDAGSVSNAQQFYRIIVP